MINIIENRYKTNSKTFDDVKKIKIEDLASLQNENLFNKCYKEIIEIKEDNKKVREIKSFREVIDEYNANELHLISLRTFKLGYTSDPSMNLDYCNYIITNNTRYRSYFIIFYYICTFLQMKSIAIFTIFSICQNNFIYIRNNFISCYRIYFE